MNSNQRLYTWIGKQVAKYRNEKKLSQTELADLAQLSRGSIANIEKGRQQSPLHVLWNIAEILDVTIDKLLPLKNIKTIEHANKFIDEMSSLEGKEKNQQVISSFLKDAF